MINIEFAFIRGVLFIRMTGNINKNNCIRIYEKTSEMIFDNKISNIVFNLKYVKRIDQSGFNILMYNLYLCLNNSGNLLFCDVPKNYIEKFSELNISLNELTALKSFAI